HHLVSHPAKEERIGLLEILGVVTMQLFVRGNRTMIAAPVQCEVDGVPKGAHSVLLKWANPCRARPTDHSQASRILTASSERAKGLRRIEQSLLPGGGPDDGQPSQMAARMAGDDDDRPARRLEPAEARRLALGRLVESLLAELVEERVRPAPQLLELLHDFVERRVVRGVVGGVPSPLG